MTKLVVVVVRSIIFHIPLYFVCMCYLRSVDFRKEFLRTGAGWTRLKFNFAGFDVGVAEISILAIKILVT